MAYIIRESNCGQEILVFDHVDFDDVNPQVPAGTVKEKEALEIAILREVEEESGLKLQVEPKYLGCFDFKKDRDQLHKRHIFKFFVEGLPDAWEHQVTGADEDDGLIFRYYWLPIEEANRKLVSEMGKYLFSLIKE